MHRSNTFISGFALCLMFFGLLQLGKAQDSTYVLCYLAVATNPHISFYSQVFASNNGLNAAPFEDPFQSWVENNYTVPSGITKLTKCTAFNDAGAASRQLDNWVADDNRIGEIVRRTRWPTP